MKDLIRVNKRAKSCKNYSRNKQRIPRGRPQGVTRRVRSDLICFMFALKAGYSRVTSSFLELNDPEAPRRALDGII